VAQSHRRRRRRRRRRLASICEAFKLGGVEMFVFA
jgi:hypothetical protein